MKNWRAAKESVWVKWTAFLPKVKLQASSLVSSRLLQIPPFLKVKLFSLHSPATVNHSAVSLGVNPQSARSDQSGNLGCQVQFRESGFLFSLVSSNVNIRKTSQWHLPHYWYVVFRVIKLTVILTRTGICFVLALVIENYQKVLFFWDPVR